MAAETRNTINSCKASLSPFNCQSVARLIFFFYFKSFKIRKIEWFLVRTKANVFNVYADVDFHFFSLQSKHLVFFKHIVVDDGLGLPRQRKRNLSPL